VSTIEDQRELKAVEYSASSTGSTFGSMRVCAAATEDPGRVRGRKEMETLLLLRRKGDGPILGKE
jgi:hypothetical protein